MDNELLRRRLSFIRQGSETERYHTKRTIQLNDVGHHSFHVAWLAHLMAEGRGFDRNPGLILAALAHDLAEFIAGDVPADAKREMGLRRQFGEFERRQLGSVDLDFETDLSEEEARILKLADAMDGALFCVSEASLGNRRMNTVFSNYRGYIAEFKPYSAVEDEIITYIDDLWTHYTSSGTMLGTPGWGRVTRKEENTMSEGAADQEAQESLTSVIRREEAEGRATPPPKGDPSKAAKPGDAQVPEQGVTAATDDLEQPDLAPKPSMPANARQHGGDHYKGTAYEHWDLVLDTGMNYFQGCATKYVARARKHSAGIALNLQKAIHYIDKAEEAEQQNRLPLLGTQSYSVADVRTFQSANGLSEEEYGIILDIIGWRWDDARAGLQKLSSF